jgi:predicted GIY-YIG superfamily endonuclease
MRTNRKTGVYSIRCGDDVIYIGSSVDIANRFAQHRNVLRNGKHGNAELQGLYNAGREFSYQVEEICYQKDLRAKEEEHIKKHFGNGMSVLNRVFAVDTSIVNIPKGLIPLVKAFVRAIEEGRIDKDLIREQLGQ